jgi:Family of unknown function (DUF6493)
MTTHDKKQLEQLKELLRPIPRGSEKTYEARFRAVPRKIIAYFSGMPEAGRRRLAPEIARLHKAALRELFEAEQTKDGPLDPHFTAVGVAATASLAELKRIGWWGSPAAYEALAVRRPSWLAEAVELGLDQASSSFSVGSVAHGINRLVAQGLLPAPQHAHYAIGIAYGYFRDGKAPLVERVRKDLPRTEAAIWRQFEVEGSGQISLVHFDKYFAKKSGGSWADTLVALAGEGRLDRQRLLDASLDALNRGFAQFRAGWFSRFHERLAPTIEERAARTDRYVDLVASPLGPTVALAMAALKTLQKAGRLDAAAVVARIEPGLFAKSAASAKGALALLTDAAKSARQLRSETARLAAIGLEHPSSEVQATALTLIEGCAPAVTREVRDAIEQRLDLVSPVLRTRAKALLGASAEPAAAQRDVALADIGELKAAAKRLPRDLRRLAGVDAALDALVRGLGDVPRTAFNGMDVPRLDADKAILPIATFEEVVDEALVAIEHPHDLDRVERVLAGALHFAAERPDNAGELLSPLAKALRRFHENGREYGYDGADALTPRGALQLVMCAYLDGMPCECAIPDNDPRAAIALRTVAMAHAICARTACVELSAPTHRGFWIHPGVLVERSKQATKAGMALLGTADQALALLRLGPDRRPEALRRAHAIDGEWGAALRYALGGDERPGKTRALWVAAARARAPFEEDKRVAKLVRPGTRGADLPPALVSRVLYRSYGTDRMFAEVAIAADDDDAQGWSLHRWWDSVKDEPGNAEPECCLITADLAMPSRLVVLRGYHTEDGRRAGSWELALWPQHPEPVFALATLSACMIDGNSGNRPGNAPLAEGLKLILDPDVPLKPMALFMLCRGLNAIDASAAQATVDALIAAADDGRLDGETLGQAMHAFLMTGLVLGKRWPARLKEVARSSVLARQVVRRALERAMHPGEPQRNPRDVHAWIETLHELSIEAGEAIEDPLAREGLARFLKAGKAGKPAQALLDRTPGGSGMARSAAATHAVRSRLGRANLWARRRAS